MRPRAASRSDEGGDAEELGDDLAQLRDRLGGIDGDAKMRAVVDAFRIPGIQRPQLVDNPAIVASRGLSTLGCRAKGRGIRAWRDVPEARGLARPLVQQQVDVLEQELSALGHGDLAR